MIRAARRARRAGLTALALAAACAVPRAAAAHPLCRMDATLDTPDRLPSDGATLAYRARFCDVSGVDGGRVEWTTFPVDPLLFVPGSGAWTACPTGGCSIDPDGTLRLGAFPLPALVCVDFWFTLTLQPGLRGREVCERGQVLVTEVGSSLPCPRPTDDPIEPLDSLPTCVTVKDTEPGCTTVPRIAPPSSVGCAGVPVGLSASGTTSSGCPVPLSWQWTRDGLPIPGATGSALSVPASEPPGAATYRVLAGCPANPLCRNLSDPVLVVRLGPGEVLAPDFACTGAPFLVSVPGGATCSIDCGNGTPPVNACARNCSYAAPGTYRVTAHAVDPGGCVADPAHDVTAGVAPAACIGGPAGSVCQDRSGGPTRLRLASCSPSGLVHSWTAAPGTLDDPAAIEPMLELPPVTVPTPVALALETSGSGCGAPARASGGFDLVPGPGLAATAAPSPGCLGHPMTFQAATSGPGPIDLAWDFGDGTTSTDPAPSHSYAAVDFYTVTATATDRSTGCVSEQRFTVFVSDGCCVDVVPEIRTLRAARSGLDVAVSWQAVALAREGYDTWVVADRTRIPAARAPGGPGIRLACGPDLAPRCVDPGAVDPAAGPLLFYQTRGICGGLEGP